MSIDIRRGSPARRLLIVAVLVAAALVRWWSDRDPEGTPSRAGIEASAGVEAMQRAFADGRSGVWVEASGTIERTLPDDNEGSRHQRMIVRISKEQTILLSHNIDLAPRIKAQEGDEIAFRGKYEWNQRGGVVHWTHHDPRAGFERTDRGGWVRSSEGLVR